MIADANMAAATRQARRSAAAFVRRWRCSRSLTQEQAAHMAGVSVRTWRDWEAGRVRMTQLEAMFRADALSELAKVAA
jgi:DNA-binding transcriptional regulator YiaG